MPFYIHHSTNMNTESEVWLYKNTWKKMYNNAKYHLFLFEKKNVWIESTGLVRIQVVVTRENKLILLWHEFVFHQLHWQKIISKDGIFQLLQKRNKKRVHFFFFNNWKGHTLCSLKCTTKVDTTRAYSYRLRPHTWTLYTNSNTSQTVDTNWIQKPKPTLSEGLRFLTTKQCPP